MGSASVLIRNPKIKEWYAEYNDFKKLLEWKKNEFIPKCEAIKHQHIEDYNTLDKKITHNINRQITKKV